MIDTKLHPWRRRVLKTICADNAKESNRRIYSLDSQLLRLNYQRERRIILRQLLRQFLYVNGVTTTQSAQDNWKESIHLIV